MHKWFMQFFRKCFVLEIELDIFTTRLRVFQEVLIFVAFYILRVQMIQILTLIIDKFRKR